jgi:hypothetical protein
MTGRERPIAAFHETKTIDHLLPWHGMLLLYGELTYRNFEFKNGSFNAASE